MKVHVESSAALPLVSAVLAFKAGSAHDPGGKEGLARATARMLRRGGAGMSSQQIEEAVDRLGADFSADAGYGWTAISMDVLGRNVDVMADLVGRLLAEPSFDEREMGKLRREIEGEIVESRDNDRLLAGRALRREIFAGHPYSRRVGGYLDTVRGLTPDDARALHGKIFCKANAVVAVSGDISKKDARRLAARLVAGLPDGEALADPVPEPGPLKGRRLVFVDKPERTQTQMFVGSLGAHTHDDDFTALQVATTVLGGTFTSRMMQEIRVQRGWSYGAYARLGIDRHRELFSQWAAPASGDAAGCLKLMLEMLQRWCDEGVTDAEVDFVKGYLGRSYVFEIDTAQKRAQQRLDADMYDLPDDYHDGYTRRVKKVTTKQANKAISRRIDPSSLVITVVGSHDEIGAQIEAAIPDLESKIVAPYDAE